MSDTGYPPVDVAKELARGEQPAIGSAPLHIPGPPRVELVKKLIVYSALIAVSLLYFVPFIWSIATSLKPLPETNHFDLIPNNPTLNAYREVLTTFNFGRFAANSAMLAAVITLSDLLLASIGGYAFARLRFPGREVLFMLVLGTLMIPDQLRFVPIFQMLANFPIFHWNLTGTFQGYIVIRLVFATSLFFMRQYFLTIPRDFEEAAKLDGAGYFKTYWRVMLPLAGPALAAVAILTFEGTWNDFFWALIVLGFADQSHYTLPLGIAQFKFQYQTLWPDLMAASILATLPIALLYVFFQRYFVAGVVSSGVKG